MSQILLTGGEVPIKREKAKINLTTAHYIVLKVFNGASELSYPEVEKRLWFRREKGDIQETGNRLRDLVNAGELERFKDKFGDTRFRLPRRA